MHIVGGRTRPLRRCCNCYATENHLLGQWHRQQVARTPAQPAAAAAATAAPADEPADRATGVAARTKPAA
eukprot:2480250-Lingulodinium_polyedra.AAC.1